MKKIFFWALCFVFCSINANAQFFPEKLSLVATHDVHDANGCVKFGRVALFPSGSVSSGRPLVFDPNVGLFLEGNLFIQRMPVMATGTTLSDREALVFDRAGRAWLTTNGGVDWKVKGSVNGEPVGSIVADGQIFVWTRDGRLSSSGDKGKVFSPVATEGKVNSLVAFGKRLLTVTDGGTFVSGEASSVVFERVNPGEGLTFRNIFPSPTGFFATDGSNVFRSEDGKSWEKAFTGDLYQNETFLSVAWESKDLGVVISDRGSLCFTFDGGRSWSKTRYRLGDRWRSATWVSGRLLVLGSERLYVFSRRGEGEQ